MRVLSRANKPTTPYSMADRLHPLRRGLVWAVAPDFRNRSELLSRALMDFEGAVVNWQQSRAESGPLVFNLIASGGGIGWPQAPVLQDNISNEYTIAVLAARSGFISSGQTRYIFCIPHPGFLASGFTCLSFYAIALPVPSGTWFGTRYMQAVDAPIDVLEFDFQVPLGAVGRLEYMAVTRRGADVRFYLNEQMSPQLAGATSEPIEWKDERTYLMTGGSGVLNNFVGLFARACVWNRALVPGEIALDRADPWGVFRPRIRPYTEAEFDHLLGDPDVRTALLADPALRTALLADSDVRAALLAQPELQEAVEGDAVVEPALSGSVEVNG